MLNRAACKRCEKRVLTSSATAKMLLISNPSDLDVVPKLDANAQLKDGNNRHGLGCVFPVDTR